MQARDFCRKLENGGRWGSNGVDGLKGAPWEPYPGAGGGYEIKSKVRLPTESGELTKIAKGKEDFAPSRLRIKKNLGKFGFTTGCIAEELTKLGDEDPTREREMVRVFDR